MHMKFLSINVNVFENQMQQESGLKSLNEGFLNHKKDVIRNDLNHSKVTSGLRNRATRCLLQKRNLQNDMFLCIKMVVFLKDPGASLLNI